MRRPSLGGEISAIIMPRLTTSRSGGAVSRIATVLREHRGMDHVSRTGIDPFQGIKGGRKCVRDDDHAMPWQQERQWMLREFVTPGGDSGGNGFAIGVGVGHSIPRHVTNLPELVGVLVRSWDRLAGVDKALHVEWVSVDHGADLRKMAVGRQVDGDFPRSFSGACEEIPLEIDFANLLNREIPLIAAAGVTGSDQGTVVVTHTQVAPGGVGKAAVEGKLGDPHQVRFRSAIALHAIGRAPRGLHSGLLSESGAVTNASRLLPPARSPLLSLQRPHRQALD